MIRHHLGWMQLYERLGSADGRRELVRLVAASQRSAGAWLNAVPALPPFQVRSWAFVLAMQRRLGLPLTLALAARDAHAMPVATRHGRELDVFGDAAENDGEHGHAERHTTLLRVIDRLLSGV